MYLSIKILDLKVNSWKSADLKVLCCRVQFLKLWGKAHVNVSVGCKIIGHIKIFLHKQEVKILQMHCIVSLNDSKRAHWGAFLRLKGVKSLSVKKV